MSEIETYTVKNFLKKTVNNLIKSTMDGQSRKDLALSRHNGSMNRARLDKSAPFAYHLDLETHSVEFVIDQVILRENSNAYSSLPDGTYHNIHDKLKVQVHAYEGQMIVNDDDSIAKVFGFENESKRKRSIWTSEGRKNQRRLKEFISSNKLRSSQEMSFYRRQAEYANYMMNYVSTSEIWENKDINLQYDEFDIVPKLLSLIRDFCQMDMMLSKVDEWRRNPLITNKLSRISAVEKSVKESYKIRYASLVILQDAFDKFVLMERELLNVSELMDFEYNLQVLEERTLDLQARKDSLVKDMQEVYMSGQAFEAIASSVNTTLDDLLELELSKQIE